MPWRIEGKRLKVLCISPADNMALFDEMGFRLGKMVKPVVAPEYRINQVLRRYFESVRQMRALDFGVVPEEIREWNPEMAPHAIVMKQNGKILPAKMGPEPSVNRVKAGNCSSGRTNRMPTPSISTTPSFTNVLR